MSKVFLFAFTAALNPVLLTATTVMLLLPHPKRLMLGYLCGAYVTGISVGLAIVHWLDGSGAVSTTKRAVDPALNIILGLLALVVAFVVGTGRQAERSARKKSEHAHQPKKVPRWQQSLSNGTARTTFLVGLLLSFPGASYLASLTSISKQDLGPTMTVLTVVAVNIVMLILLELPLLAYTIAPDSTPAAIERFRAWLSQNGQRAVTIGAAVIGVALIARGIVNF